MIFDVALLVDFGSSARRLSPGAFAGWAAEKTLFLSSEMRELAELRRTVASALRNDGLTVVMFEDLGGRDEDAERAYLEGVARSDVYVGIVADRYGTMLPSGRSPTHEEYLEARRRGKRISVWVDADGSRRQGDARDFVDAVRVFHTTGQYRDASDLAERLRERLRELAADDEAPWIKVGDAVIRADWIRDTGDLLALEADVRDAEVAAYLESLRTDRWGQSPSVKIATAHRAGEGRVTAVVSEARAVSVRKLRIEADLHWADGRGDSMATSYSGISAQDLAEYRIRQGLLGEPPPERLQISHGWNPLGQVRDPLAPLAGMPLSHGAIEAIARILVVEELLGTNAASRVTHFALGPAYQGKRQIELTYRDPERYADQTPEERTIEGSRPDP